jgi:peptidoglycan/LPS O-acetylase OafA/YrhL
VDFRPDVEGLRAVAVVLVVLFHAGFAPLPGGFVGVDVFFVISGFLITGLIVDELMRTGTISLSNFYSRRARRLLPAAGTVLVTTAVVFNIVMPSIDQPALGADLMAATLWFANWHFAAASTDYFAVACRAQPRPALLVAERGGAVLPVLAAAGAGRGRADRLAPATGVPGPAGGPPRAR